LPASKEWEKAVQTAKRDVFKAILETKRSKQYDTEAERERDMQHLRGWRDCIEQITRDVDGK